MIVTVTGTGSECNGGAVITNEEKKKIKTGRDYPALNAEFALFRSGIHTAYRKNRWYREDSIY